MIQFVGTAPIERAVSVEHESSTSPVRSSSVRQTNRVMRFASMRFEVARLASAPRIASIETPEFSRRP